MGNLTHDEITTLFLAIGILLGAARLLGELFQRLGQPAVIGEITAGILLGPTVFGNLSPELFAMLFPREGGPAIALEGLTTVAIALFLLVAGLEIDLSTVWRQGRTAMTVGVAGIVGPFTIGFGAAWFAPGPMGADPGADLFIFALFMATALSISALPVIAKTLMDLNLFRTDLGMIIVAAAVFNDLIGWIIFAMILAMLGSGSSGPGIGTTIALTLAFTLGTLTIGRWLIHRSLPWIQANASWPGGVLGFALTLALFGAAFTEWLGVHAIFGAFLVGVALGDSSHLRKQTRKTIEQFISFIFAPLFFGSIGLYVDFFANFDLTLVLVIFIIATIGKLAGCLVGARLTGMPSREGWAIAFGMNARGTMEIILGLLALQAGLISDRLFVALVIMALGTSVLSGPMMQRILRRVRPIRFADYLSERSFAGHLSARSRWEAIQELCNAIARSAGMDAQILSDAVWQREQLMATGLAHRVAVPNARIPGLREPVVALGLSRGGIDFDAPDGQTAQIICLVLVPEEDDGAQWTILADISELFADARMREQTMRVYGYTELRALFKLTQELAHEDEEEHAARPRQGQIIVGAGPLARAWARRLQELGSPVWLIDTNRNNVEAAQREGLGVVSGNALREVTLMQAHAFQARGLIALTPNAETNLEIADFAHREFGVPSAWVAATGDRPIPEDDWIHPLSVETRYLLSRWDEMLSQGVERWERVTIEEAGAMATTVSPENVPHGAFLPLIIEHREQEILRAAVFVGRDGVGLSPAWPGMPLEPGDTVHGLVIADDIDSLGQRVRRLVERAPILDLDGELDSSAMFRQAAEALAVRLHLEPEDLVDLFLERERVQGGALTTELAIPHVLLDGKGIFELVICRSRDGVRFGPENHHVHAVFVLASTRDERNLHLQMLAALAAIAQKPDFAASWNGMPDTESLRSWIIESLAGRPGRA